MIINGDWLNSWAYTCVFFVPDPDVLFSCDYAWAHRLISQERTGLTVHLLEPELGLATKIRFRKSGDFFKNLASSKNFTVFKVKMSVKYVKKDLEIGIV